MTLVFVSSSLMIHVSVKGLNGDLFSVELSPGHQTVREVISSIKPLLHLHHPYDAVDILHPSSVHQSSRSPFVFKNKLCKMNDDTIVHEGVHYLFHIRSFDKIIKHAARTYSNVSLNTLKNHRVDHHLNFVIFREWAETFELIDAEFPHILPMDPPGYVQRLKMEDGKEDIDFQDEFMGHLHRFGERMWCKNPYLRNDEEVEEKHDPSNDGEPLIRMYVARRRLREFLELSRNEDWARNVYIP